MNRRKIFALLAAIPFASAARAVSVVENPTIKPRLPFSDALVSIRDELMPRLRQFETEEIELDIFADFTHDALLVKGYNLKQRRGLGFAITREEMSSGHYRARFAPQLVTLTALLAKE